MTKRKRRNHSPVFKAKVALAAVRGGAHPGRSGRAVRGAPESDPGLEEEVGGGGRARVRRRCDRGCAFRAGDRAAPRQDWSADDGEGFFVQSARSRPVSERRAMIHADHPLAVTRRCVLLDVARSTVYYRPHRDLSGGPGPDAPLGRDPLGVAVLRQSPPSRRARDPGVPGESQASPAPGAPDGPARPVSEAAHEPARGRTHGVSVPAEGPVHRATESGVGDRYLLHPDGAGVHVSSGHHGLVLAPRPGLAGVEYLRQRLLCRSPRGRAHPLWAAGDLQYGPRRSVHVHGVYDGAQGPCGGHQHGRQGPLGRQRVRRASLAQRQIRGCVSPCV